MSATPTVSSEKKSVATAEIIQGLTRSFGDASSSYYQAREYGFKGATSYANSIFNASMLNDDAEIIRNRADKYLIDITNNFNVSQKERQSYVQYSRKLNRRARSQQEASLAKAGVVINTGTANVVQTETALYNELETMEGYRKQGRINADQYSAGLAQVNDMFTASLSKSKQAIFAKAQGKIDKIYADANAKTAKQSGTATILGGLAQAGVQAYSAGLFKI